MNEADIRAKAMRDAAEYLLLELETDREARADPVQLVRAFRDMGGPPGWWHPGYQLSPEERERLRQSERKAREDERARGQAAYERQAEREWDRRNGNDRR